MRTGILVVMIVALAGLVLAAPRLAVKCLDGSTIAADAIDRTVLRLMRAADVGGRRDFDLQSRRGRLLASLRFPTRPEADTHRRFRHGGVFTKVAFTYLVMQLSMTEH
jgi:hypothetical protein